MRNALIEASAAPAAFMSALLEVAGWRVDTSIPRPIGTPPVVEIDAVTLELLKGVLPGMQAISGYGSSLSGRYVRWGNSTEFSFVPVSSRAICLGQFGKAAMAAATVRRNGQKHLAPCTTAWTVNGRQPDVAGLFDRWGTRRIAQSRVFLKEPLETVVSWMATTELGWLYALPLSNKIVSLQFAAPMEVFCFFDPMELFDRAINELGVPALRNFQSLTKPVVYEGAPQLSRRLSRRNSIAFASAAVRFDPLCSQGISNWVRQAILAAATLEAIESGGDESALLSSYRTRILQIFASHLQHCALLYQQAGLGKWWRAENEQIRIAADAVSKTLRQADTDRYNLIVT